jgi:RHS repeat-associated protein
MKRYWNGIETGYNPGVLEARGAGAGIQQCTNPPHDNVFERTVTRLTFTSPDGTEYELRDQLTNGQVMPLTSITPCPSAGPLRGRYFSTSDGSSVTFISDTDVRDDIYTSGGASTYTLSGFLLLRGGARYRIDNGKVTWIRDRNGNRLTFTYDSFSRMISVTDSLNRQVTVAYGNPDVITYKGAGGSLRTIRVWRANLQSALRPNSGYSIQNSLQLFPELNGATGSALYNPSVISSIELPDGRQYRFYYNPYGELARVELPTGGAIEYDYAPGVVSENLYNYLTGTWMTSSLSGVTGGSNPQGGEEFEIYRRVVERRVYSDGATLDTKMTYSRPGDFPGVYSVVDQYNSGGVLLSRSKHYYDGSARSSLFQGPTDYPSWKEGKETKTEWLDANGATVLRRQVNTCQQRAAISWYTGPPDLSPPNDPRLVETVTTLADANLVSKQTFDYDQYNNQTDVYEYGFGAGAPGPLIRRTHTSYLTTNPHQGNADYAADYNIHIRNLPAQKIVYDASGNVRSQTDYIYDHYEVFAPVGRPGIVQHADTLHYGAWGNVTEVILRNPSGAPSEVHLRNQYDIAGNLVKAVDGRGFATDFDYSDRFGSPDNEAQSNAGAPELAGGFSYAFPTKVTNALGHTEYTQYDYYLGAPVNTEDANGIISSVAYNDFLDRPTQGIRARYKITTPPCAPPSICVPAEKRQTTIIYDDANHMIITTSDQGAFGDNILTSKSYYDGLGRTWRGAVSEGATWTIKDTQFDALGRVSQVSNPYRAADPSSASPPAGLWTTTNYDALSRVTQVITPDGAHVDTAYSGNQVTFTDQAGKKRRSETDGLGRLVKVTEDPGEGRLNYDTTYLYDALGNLRKVTQGAQTRWFAYDLFSRLIRAKNPEQADNSALSYTDPVTQHNGWSIAYSYDANGNLTQRIDARGIETKYYYDALNRNWGIDYINGSQKSNVARVFDGAVNGKGRLYWDRTQEGGTQEMGANVTMNVTDSYDALGRPLQKRQHFWQASTNWGPGYYMQQTYDLAGNVKSLTYPSGRTVNYSYDQVGRLSGFSGNLGGSPSTYADSIGYNAAGQMIKERFGTNTSLYHNSHYNNRLQLVDTRLGDSATDEWSWSRGAIAFFYGTTAANGWNQFANDTDNNGNLRRQMNFVPLAGGGDVIPQLNDYTYDPLNRIAAVRELQRNGSAQWADSVSQAYSYDRWGNRTLDLSGGGGGEVVWVDDALPAGATVGSDGGDSWTWLSSNPSPYSGTVFHQSNIAAGQHQHYFSGATQTLQVNAGDRLYAYVYLDPANMPQEVMLQWSEVSAGWSYKAYWGANLLTWPVEGTKINVGPLPAAGGWVRLEVPASSLGLEGKTLNGMAFTLYGGRASWDKAGKVGFLYGAGPPINNRVYTVDAVTNRLTSVNGAPMSYDGAGNVTSDPMTGGLMTYDPENRMLTATNGGASGSYTYNADGRRVGRITGGLETWQVYGIGGELLAEYQLVSGTPTLKKEYGYRNGQLLVVWDGGETGDRQLQWLVQDHLGSTRMVVDRSGSLAGIKRHDFLPFGEELGAGIGIRSASNGYSADSVRQKFTGHERDGETGLDFAQARYYSNVQGRFTSPDNPLADQDPEDPQSWSLYAYVRNRPLAHIDRNGRACAKSLGNTGSGYCRRASAYAYYDTMPEINNRTRFFAAAAAVSQALASGDTFWGIERRFISTKTQAFLSGVGEELQRLNRGFAQALQEGGNLTLSGPDPTGPALDKKLIHFEQSTIQQLLNNLKEKDPDGYNQVIEENNALLNPTDKMKKGAEIFPTDAAFGKILDAVRKDLGRNIDFAKQSDREAIGLKLVEHIRTTGGCDVVDGVRISGCK